MRLIPFVFVLSILCTAACGGGGSGPQCMCDPANGTGVCIADQCTLESCEIGFEDCDRDVSNGCELDISVQTCACTPGATDACYTGPQGTEGIGVCAPGTTTCLPSGTGWAACEAEIVPLREVCANSLDDDCNGVADDGLDEDGDGWLTCEGDCCDALVDGCSEPSLVNPGAFEIIDNQFDDNCNAMVDEAPLDCSAQSLFTTTPEDVANAMELCTFVGVNDPLRPWGVLSAQFRLADGSIPNGATLLEMSTRQAAVLTDYGTGGVVPVVGSTMAGLSNGNMRDANDPNYVNPNGGTNLGNGGQPPAAYLAAHGGSLPSSQSCNGSCPAGSGANDSVNLSLTIRVPTNATGLSYRWRFFTAEYWTYSCTQYNDFHLALLQSAAPGLPADTNIVYDSLANPVSVNNAFVEICVPKGCYTCPDGATELQGTGMQLGNTGAGTVWHTVTAPVVPGETITLELMVFDVSDNILDSNVLLDGFSWIP